MIENYAVEQGPSREANSSSAYQQIPSILWNPSVLCSPLVPILSQKNPMHAIPSYF